MIAPFSFSDFSSWYLCLLVVLALFHICLSNQKFDNVLCKEDEKQALLQFKQGLIDEADRLASWTDDYHHDCCKWVGVVCDNFTGYVHEIHLPGADGHCLSYKDIYIREYKDTSNQRLKGNLSSSLLHLKQLRHLDLSCNDFGGIQVPSFIGSLGNLRYLNLSSSNFVGIITPQLGNLSKLHVLSLGSFYFSDELTSMRDMQWLSSLHMLHHLDMSGVDLSQAINWFQVISSLSFLDQLHLSACRLSNFHPFVPSLNITSLSLLDLSGNNFNSLVPRWIFSTTSLVSLHLTRCSFYGPIPSTSDSFRNLTYLKFLRVSRNSFMNSPLVLKGLSSVGGNLIRLDISSCGISSSVLDSLRNLTSLCMLDLSENELTKMIPRSLGNNLCNLRNIDLSGSHFRKFTLTYLLGSFFKCKSPRLESLMLESVRLSGHIPDKLGNLTHLEDLRLQNNYITGTIPDSIGRLSSMRTIKLFNNLISGPIPYSIGQLTLLEVFDVSDNKVNGSLPDSIGRLSSLEVLDLSLNRLTVVLPDSLGQLSKLSQLSFPNNNLSGVVTEAHFTRLGSLLLLNGAGNKLILRQRFADWNPPFLKIEHLLLGSWSLGPRFPLWLRLLKELVQMDISNTNISAPLPESLWRSFPRLVSLDMSRNHIQGKLFGILPTLEFLDLSFNEFTGPLPDLTNSSLLFLDLSYNFFVGSLHHSLCFNDLNCMDVLILGNNRFSGVIPECLENLTRLSFLNLQNNNLSAGIPTTLGFLSSLESLNLHGNKLTGKIPDSLRCLTKLHVLQLGGNKLVGSIPEWFGKNFSFLKILNLRSNYFGGNIPHQLCYLTYIQILDLADNNLSGNIPRCFNRFKVLSGKEPLLLDPFAFSHETYSGRALNGDSLVIKGREDTYKSILSLVAILDLSVNNLVGHIPSELTSLKALHSLNLSRNQLSGRIPEKTGDLKSLESFDVSLNSLSGELPVSLSNLNFLSVFNVSYNNLTGRIPTRIQLQGLDKSNFFGNKLCGAPLIDHCIEVEVIDTNQEEDDGQDWGFIISMLLGFVAGFWIVVAPLMVSRSLRIAYFRFLSELRYRVYDFMHKYVM